MGTRFKVWVYPRHPIVTGLRIEDAVNAQLLRELIMERGYGRLLGNVSERNQQRESQKKAFHEFDVFHEQSFLLPHLLDILENVPEIELRIVNDEFRESVGSIRLPPK